MNLDEFYIRLRNHAWAHPDSWFLKRDDFDYSITRIRCSLPDPEPYYPDQVAVYCPVSAVARNVNALSSPVNAAVDILNMTEEDAESVVSAADHTCWNTPFDEEIRRKLLQAVGLQCDGS